MRNPSDFDRLDTRLVFKTYAFVAWVAGGLLAAWGQIWFGSDLPGLPWGKAAAIRIVGAMIVAAGCFSRAMAGADDPDARRRGLLWFAGGHAIVLAMVGIQLTSVLDGSGSAARFSFQALFIVTLLLFYFYQTAEGHPIGRLKQHTTLFPSVVRFPGDGGQPLTGARPSVERLRSTYEEKIRAAASQEERNRLARDLHDSIKQQIFVIQTAAATAQARFDNDRAGARNRARTDPDVGPRSHGRDGSHARSASGGTAREHGPGRSTEEAVRGPRIPDRRRSPFRVGHVARPP